ncbi:hypothetical protein HDU76_006088, partial [Blyttiomyces sp. JEL0837]
MPGSLELPATANIKMTSKLNSEKLSLEWTIPFLSGQCHRFANMEPPEKKGFIEILLWTIEMAEESELADIGIVVQHIVQSSTTTGISEELYQSMLNCMQVWLGKCKDMLLGKNRSEEDQPACIVAESVLDRMGELILETNSERTTRFDNLETETKNRTMRVIEVASRITLTLTSEAADYTRKASKLLDVSSSTSQSRFNAIRESGAKLAVCVVSRTCDRVDLSQTR